jgi:hypothetical protein
MLLFADEADSFFINWLERQEKTEEAGLLRLDIDEAIVKL